MDDSDQTVATKRLEAVHAASVKMLQEEIRDRNTELAALRKVAEAADACIQADTCSHLWGTRMARKGHLSQALADWRAMGSKAE